MRLSSCTGVNSLVEVGVQVSSCGVGLLSSCIGQGLSSTVSHVGWGTFSGVVCRLLSSCLELHFYLSCSEGYLGCSLVVVWCSFLVVLRSYLDLP